MDRRNSLKNFLKTFGLTLIGSAGGACGEQQRKRQNGAVSASAKKQVVVID